MEELQEWMYLAYVRGLRSHNSVLWPVAGVALLHLAALHMKILQDRRRFACASVRRVWEDLRSGVIEALARGTEGSFEENLPV